MSTAVVSRALLECCTLIYVEVAENSNKVWKGSAYNDGTFIAEWGRVGAQLQSQQKSYHSAKLALDKLEQMKQQKLNKGYTEAQVLADDGIDNQPTQQDLEAIAASQIRYGEDARAQQLIRYLTEVNIHEIVSQTNIAYNAATGNFRTPLGLVTRDAIAQARLYLEQMAAPPRKSDRLLRHLVSQYLRLIPQKVGIRLDASIFRTKAELQRQKELLEALDTALMQTEPNPKIFDCSLRRVPGSTPEGRSTFHQLRELYESTLNPHHLTANYKLRRIYEIEIPSMQRAFAQKSSAIGNVKLHWHGTKASNLLSIFKGGLVIPPSSAIQCTGRMFGNGIYGSEQSTKALNYATNYWNASGSGNQRAFMLLCEFAMGKTFHLQKPKRSYPLPGFDSTYVRPGMANVINQESIVYDAAQVNIKYLCEFVD
ncbi:WGR domain-containing protein [Oscillatoria sp. FACHB-1406]|uniref:WGR domain-containing protein n=1 Tax=Oscillatoria sp. FACHB-1406 TaxID=2692846 RepID=UPI0016880784|nr:WGR domain-containing protein [Oscillatoria sp. FACHB-1406]MBD2577756.1 WGR domain-containing protein [Oscillatoria sp. FACHB-1406]